MLANHFVPKRVIVGVIKKKLSDHEISAGVDFSFQIMPIDVFAGFASDMALGKAGDADAKSILLPDEFNELVRKLESAWSWAKYSQKRVDTPRALNHPIRIR